MNREVLSQSAWLWSSTQGGEFWGGSCGKVSEQEHSSGGDNAAGYPGFSATLAIKTQ